MSYRTFTKNYILSRLTVTISIGNILDFNNFTEEELAIFYKKIGENVKKYRKEKSLTQMQLALAIDHSSVGHIAKAELCKYNKHFNLEQIYKIAKVLEIEPSLLIE